VRYDFFAGKMEIDLLVADFNGDSAVKIDPAHPKHPDVKTDRRVNVADGQY
jgi:hypothetical protein